MNLRRRFNRLATTTWAKAPSREFKAKDIWALREGLQVEGRVRGFALFNLGVDSKLRGCDLVSLKVRDMSHGDQVAIRAIVRPYYSRSSVQNYAT